MKLVTYIESLQELKIFVEKRSAEIEYELIVGVESLSRYSKTSLDELLSLVQFASKNGIALILEWDALFMQERFLKITSVLDHLPLHEFKAIRLQDPGAIHYIKTHYPWLKMQVILENGNHNLEGLRKWEEFLGDQCDRLILSNELSREVLKDYACQLRVPIEIQVFGRLLLFYSPRSLLSALDKDQLKKSYIEASGSSQESPHTGFPLIENQHGTFMFNVKDLSLLDSLDEIEEMGISYARVDLRFDRNFSNYLDDILDLFSGRATDFLTRLKLNHVRPIIKAFYTINKTDVLFTKLKNKRTQRQDQNYIGEIVDVEREAQLAFMVKTDVFNHSIPSSIFMITPEGKEKTVSLSWVKTSTGEIVTSAKKNDLLLIPYLNGVTVKTQLYLIT